ncbi:hypothetical protein Tco_0873406 [Tanacetum coccineum]
MCVQYDNKGPSIASVPKEGPSIQGLLEWYGYDTVEEYLKDTFFPITDKDTTDKDRTDEDAIHESYSPKSKVSDVIEVMHLQQAFAKSICFAGSYCICSKHLQQAFALLQAIAFALHLQQEFATSICFAASYCNKHLQQAFALLQAIAFAAFVVVFALLQATATSINKHL